MVGVDLPHLDERVMVLGAGWVGSRLASSLSASGTPVCVTNRPDFSSRRKEPYFAPVQLHDPPVRRLQFDLSMPETWDNLPPPESLGAAVITFPPSLEHATAFYDAYLSRVKRVIAYSSTAVYRIDKPGQAVNEETPLKPTARAAVDAFLQSRGATVLTISGIFGEPRGARGVCTCLAAYASSGGALNGQKAVNMVHVDDIITATAHSLMAPQTAGKRLNVAGDVFRLHELMCHCRYPQAETAKQAEDTDLSSKIVSSQRLLDDVLPEGFEFVPPLETPAQTAARVAAAAARAEQARAKAKTKAAAIAGG